MRIVQLLFGVWVGICFLACGEKSDSFTREERERIGHSEEEGIMPLFLVTNRVDSLFLRLQAKEFGKEDVETETFRVLRSRMLATVRDSLNEGVGIAAPQVGISRQFHGIHELHAFHVFRSRCFAALSAVYRNLVLVSFTLFFSLTGRE